MKHTLFTACLAVLIVTLAPSWAAAHGTDSGPSACPEEGAKATPADAAPAPLLKTVRLIGASVTDGFGTADELKTGTSVPLTTFLRASFADRNGAADVQEFSSAMFFRAPEIIGAQLASRAQAADPSLVIALDFLFWYGYGIDTVKSPRRGAGLEKGLKLLERFTCPLIVGTLPNVEHSLEGVGPFGGPILSPLQLPTEAERVAMNARLRQWAAERDHVHVIDLGTTFRKMVAKEKLELRGASWRVQDLGEALQADLLHPNLDGYIWTVLTVADAIAQCEGAGADDFLFDPAAIKGRFLASIQSQQEKHAQRQARSKTRARAREKARRETAGK